MRFLAQSVCRPLTLPFLIGSLGLLSASATEPEKVTLLKDVEFSLMMDGRPVGEITVPAGREVEVMSVDNDILTLEARGAVATVGIAQTDYKERRMALQTVEAPTSEPASTPSTPPPIETDPPKDEPEPEPKATDPVMFDYKAEGSGFEIAQFRLWHPNPKTPTRAVLICVPGANGDGRGMANQSQWQALATEFDLALIACHLSGGDYQNPASGTGQAVDDALEAFGEKIGQRGLEELPLVMWGHSAGGQFNYNYSQWEPDRILTFIVNKGGYYVKPEEDDSHEIPAMFFLGTQDKDYRVEGITNIYLEGAENEALWCLFREPGGHGVGASLRYAMKYYRTIIPMRLPEGESRLQSLDRAEGWLGHLETYEILPAKSADWNPENTAWFPTEELAQDWVEIVTP